MTSEDTPRPADAASEGAASGGMDNWIQQIRQQETPPPPLKTAPRSTGIRMLAGGLALLAVGLAGYSFFGTSASGPPPPGKGAVQGIVRDAESRPLGHARIFLVSNPTISATTDANGAFRLSRVPSGPQTVVVVVGDFGQEFPLEVKPGTANNAGTLVYRDYPESEAG